MTTQSLAPGEAHLHWFSLDVPDVARRKFASVLSRSEAARFARLVNENDRQRSCVARGMLRSVLAQYLPLAPQELLLQSGPHGKPYLATGPNNLALEFNLSHSGGWGIILVARTPVGIDLEVLRDDVKAEAVAEAYFTTEEQTALYAVPQEERPRQFFRSWTRKEAFLKGIGSGLTIRATSVSIHPIGTAQGAANHLRIYAPCLDPEPSNWNIRDLELRPGLVAAVAYRGKLGPLEFKTLPGFEH